MNLFAELTTENKLIVLVMIAISLLGFIFLFRKGILYRSIGILITIGIVSLYLYFFKGNNLFIGLLLVPPFIIGLLTSFFKSKPKEPNPKEVHFPTNKKNIFIPNVNTGVFIVAGAGSGKTESPIYYLMKHFAEHQFTGVIYDYKNGELSEIAFGLFGDRLKPIALHNVNYSYRINPIAPEYIENEVDIENISKSILVNLKGKDEKEDFFYSAGAGLFAAIILKLRTYHPDMCTLPHAVAFFLSLEELLNAQDEDNPQPFKPLVDWLKTDPRVMSQASAFLMGIQSTRQTAAVLASLASLLRKVVNLEAFYILSGNEINLNVNDHEIDIVLSVLNEPKNASALTPLLAAILQTTTSQMMQRNRKQSFVLLDEAPTVKLLNMAKIPATMRSFGVSTVYAIQDISQGYVQYGRDDFREITSNLGTQILGKSNDPDTAKFNEQYFELVKEKQVSKNLKGGSDLFGSTNSRTISQREVSKVRAYEFTQFKVGQFAFISGGKSQVVQFRKAAINKPQLNRVRTVSKEDLELHFQKIFDDVRTLF